MGLLFGPSSYVHPRGLPYALDNDRFSVWSKGKDWAKNEYLSFLEMVKAKINYPPSWAIVPDVVADCGVTFEWWKEWYKILAEGKWTKLALAVQDGMTIEMVKKLRPKPNVVFVGGSTEWKWRTVQSWCRNFPRVHVGRVNTRRMLWSCHRYGVESTDGTGWFHHKQYRQLVEYLRRSSQGIGPPVRGFFG